MLCKSYTLKPGSHLPKKFGFFCFSESPLKIIKNDFYFILKALFILKIIMLRYLNFCPDFLVMWENDLITKLRLISKFKTSKPGKQTFITHTLPNISRSKGNQAMKFGQ